MPPTARKSRPESNLAVTRVSNNEIKTAVDVLTETSYKAKQAQRWVNHRQKQPKKEYTFGARVYKRRLEEAQNLEGNLSTSKRRKIVLQKAQEYRRPIKSFDSNCGNIYNEILQTCNKDKAAAQAGISKLIDIVFGENSPLYESGKADIENIFNRQIVNRGLQVSLKYGSPQQLRQIIDNALPYFAKLAQSKGGHFLCLKIIQYSSFDKEARDRLLENLFENSKVYLTRFGSKVWDAIARKYQDMSDRLIFHALMKNSIDSLSKTLRRRGIVFPDPEKLPVKNVRTAFELLVEANLMGEDDYVSLLQGVLDKIVTKELLSSEITQTFLLRIWQNRSKFVKCPMAMLCESTFEGAHQLLMYADGVAVLCAMMGYWSAKDRKAFLQKMREQMTLDKKTWADYVCNDIDFVAVVRLISVIDDTRLSGEGILGSMMKFKPKRDGSLSAADPECIDKIINDKNCLRMMLWLVNCNAARPFVTKQERLLFELPAPSSKKEKEMRRTELVKRYIQPMLENALVSAEPSSDETIQKLRECITNEFSKAEE